MYTKTATELNVNPHSNMFTITNNQLFTAIAEHVDLDTISNQELREIFTIVVSQVQHINWKEVVAQSIENLPFGLHQVQVARYGQYPCEGCPDGMMDGDQCYHKHACRAWDVYIEGGSI
jgi:hypothetical protein